MSKTKSIMGDKKVRKGQIIENENKGNKIKIHRILICSLLQ